MENSLTVKIAKWIGISSQVVDKVFGTFLIILIIWIIRKITFRLIQKAIDTRDLSDRDLERIYFAKRAINYIFATIAILLIGRIWVSGFRNLGTFLGLLSAGVAVALGDLLSSFVGWLFILLRRPYAVGDRIEIDGHLGDVVDIRLFNTYLLECGNWVEADQSTGRILLIPNNFIFKKPIANFTQGFNYIWDEVPVLITFESDWKKARKILEEIAIKIGSPMVEDAKKQLKYVASEHRIIFKTLTPIVYLSVQDSGILLTIRYLTPPRKRRTNQGLIWEAILEAFEKEGRIDLAYPTQRTYLNFVEGKVETRPKE